jgi:hypothetical protein
MCRSLGLLAQNWVTSGGSICIYSGSQPWCWLWSNNPAGTPVFLNAILAGAPPLPNTLWEFNGAGAIQPLDVVGGSLPYCVQQAPNIWGAISIQACSGSWTQVSSFILLPATTEMLKLFHHFHTRFSTGISLPMVSTSEQKTTST